LKTLHHKILVLLATLLLTIPAIADDNTALAELLQQSTYPIALENGELKGPGAALILDSAAGTQFVALGEEHYNFYIPDITTALFAALHERYGYQFLMTEQDPVMMELVSRPPVRGDLQEINALATEYPMGVTFNSEQELRMLADLGRISTTRGDVIWGCDQGFGVTHTLDQLLQELGDEDTRAADAVRAFRQIAAENEAVRDLSDGTFMFHQDAADFISLKAQVNPPPGSRSEWLLDVLVNSSQIYDYYENGNQGLLPGYYENNRFREEHLKDLCLAKYRAAAKQDPLPRALMKFGTWHLYQGLSPTRLHTIGDFFAGVARFNGQGFLSIQFVSRPDNPEEHMSEIGFIWPFVRDLDPDEFAVIDLRPFRPYPNRALVQNGESEEWAAEHKEDFVRLVYGYDLIFFIGASKEATFAPGLEPK